METIDIMAALKTSLGRQSSCSHDAGFRDLQIIDPQPGRSPQVMKGRCRSCEEFRYFDRTAAIYRTPYDAYRGENPERIRS